MSRLGDWVDARLPYRRIWKQYATEYYVPKNLNFYYIFGFLALVVLFNQLVTGFWLTLFYTPTVVDAFHSVQYIMRDVSYGWLLRYMHTTGASALFIVLYLHLFRGILYGSYQKPRELVWIFGMFLFFLLMSEACFGYLLPWGQLSFWGAQVLTNLVGSLPYVGEFLTRLIRGDYGVSDVTLHRFFALHVIGIPLLVFCVVGLHIVSLRQVGSTNPKGIDLPQEEKIPFHPFYTIKDALAALGFFIGFFAVVFYFPDMNGYFLDSNNAMPANPMITPDAITPLWYLSPFYAMLRAIPNKLMGVVVMSSSMIILIFLPWLDRSPVRTIRQKSRFAQGVFTLFVVSFIGLGVLGMQEITPLTLQLARGLTGVYFAYFILMPWYNRRDPSCVV
jgi:ubiquinol-cytochrome c reductase cytochrome b subunit